MSTQGRKITVQKVEDQVASVKLKFIFWYHSVRLNTLHLITATRQTNILKNSESRVKM